MDELRNNLDELPDVDIVLLAIPVTSRLPYIEYFSSIDVAIFSEKPFAIDYNSHLDILKLTNIATVNYHRVTYSCVMEIKQIIQTGIFGDLEKVDISDGGIIGPTGKSKNSYQNDEKKSGGGVLNEWGIHTISQLCHIFDDKKLVIVDSKLKTQNNFDVDTKILFRVDSKNTSTNISYNISIIKKYTPISILRMRLFLLISLDLTPHWL